MQYTNVIATAVTCLCTSFTACSSSSTCNWDRESWSVLENVKSVGGDCAKIQRPSFCKDFATIPIPASIVTCDFGILLIVDHKSVLAIILPERKSTTIRVLYKDGRIGYETVETLDLSS